MELRYSRHSGDVVATQLRQLLTFGGIDIYESVHVTDDEALYTVQGM